MCPRSEVVRPPDDDLPLGVVHRAHDRGDDALRGRHRRQRSYLALPTAAKNVEYINTMATASRA